MEKGGFGRPLTNRFIAFELARGRKAMANETKPQQQVRIEPEIALRNIVRNMEIEGFQVSNVTIEGCRRILKSGENGKSVANILVGDIVKSEEHEDYNLQES